MNSNRYEDEFGSEFASAVATKRDLLVQGGEVSRTYVDLKFGINQETYGPRLYANFKPSMPIINPGSLM